MATFVLEDLDGTLEVLVFPENYSKVALRLADDQVVVVKGKAEAVDEGKPRLLPARCSPWSSQAQRSAPPHGASPARAWGSHKGERLRDISRRAPRADCSSLSSLTRPDAAGLTLAPSARYRVRPDAGLRDEIEALFAREACSTPAQTEGADARGAGCVQATLPRSGGVVMAEADFEAPIRSWPRASRTWRAIRATARRTRKSSGCDASSPRCAETSTRD